MQLSFQADIPLFQQIADAIEEGIISGAFAEEAQIPSTTEMSAQLKINPATVLKGMNILVDQDILYKRRGVGMFVREGAQQRIRKRRSAAFESTYVRPMLQEAGKLGLSTADVIAMIEGGDLHDGN